MFITLHWQLLAPLDSEAHQVLLDTKALRFYLEQFAYHELNPFAAASCSLQTPIPNPSSENGRASAILATGIFDDPMTLFIYNLEDCKEQVFLF
jgi:hypothetical protein